MWIVIVIRKLGDQIWGVVSRQHIFSHQWRTSRVDVQGSRLHCKHLKCFPKTTLKRNFQLYLFTKHQYVERTKVSSLLKIPAEELKEIFAGISKLQTHSKGWELTLPTDHDFMSKHADLVQRQNLFWEHRFHQLSQFLNQPSRQRRKSKSASESDGGGGKTRTSSVSW